MRKSIAVTLWRLASGNSLRTTGKTLAFGKSTAVETTNKFCEMLNLYEIFFINIPVNRRDKGDAIVKFRESKNCITPLAGEVIYIR